MSLRTATLLSFALSPVALAQSEPAPSVRVHGTLLDEAFEPAASVPLGRLVGYEPLVEPALQNPIARSGDDGRFDVTVALDAVGPTWLVIGGDTFAMHWLELEADEPDVDLGAFALPRAFVAVGRVHDEQGGVPKGAFVTGDDHLLHSWAVLMRVSTLRLHTRAAVGDDGVFHLPGMVRSAGTLVVSCPGYYDTEIEPLAAGDPIDVTLQPSAMVRGRVLDPDGAPVAGARVSLRGSEVVSDADGTFATWRRHRGPLSVMATLEIEGRPIYARTEVPDASAPIELRFDANEMRGKRLKVHAVAADGVPLQVFDAFVAWESEGDDEFLVSAALMATAAHGCRDHATSGEASLPGPDNPAKNGTVMVRAAGHGWGTAKVEAAAYDEEPLVVAMTKAVRVTGSVNDADGNPVVGALVVAMSQPRAPASQSLLQERSERCSIADSPDAALTNANGTWAIDDLPAERVTLCLLIDGKLVRPLHPIDLRQGRPMEPQEWTAPQRAILAGRIQGVTRRDLQVRLEGEHRGPVFPPSLPDYGHAVPVGDDGSFRFDAHAPIVWLPEVLLPAAPRSGIRLKVECPGWDAARGDEDDYTSTMPEVVVVTGHVDGEVPWSRLAVVNDDTWSGLFDDTFSGSIALLAPDRTFHLLLPKARTELRLIDVETGVPLAFRTVEPEALTKAVDWSCPTHPLQLRFQRQDDTAAELCNIQLLLPKDCWPEVFERHEPPFDGLIGVIWLCRTEGTRTVWLPKRLGGLMLGIEDPPVLQPPRTQVRVDVAELRDELSLRVEGRTITVVEQAPQSDK